MKYEILKETYELDFVIHLDPGDGTVESDTVTVKVGSAFVPPSITPPEGKVFVGWFRDTEYSQKAVAGDIVDSTFSTIYAKLLDYQPLEYVMSTGTQWIDTGVKDTYRILTEAELTFETELVGNYRTIGAGMWSNAHRFGFTSSGFYSVGLGGSSQTSYSDIGLGEKFKIRLYANTVECVGKRTFTAEMGMYEFDNIFVFIGNNDLVQPGKLYTLKIYEDDELIRNYIPCKDSIGRVCLYEEVSGQFVYAQGGEDFVGPEE